MENSAALILTDERRAVFYLPLLLFAFLLLPSLPLHSRAAPVFRAASSAPFTFRTRRPSMKTKKSLKTTALAICVALACAAVSLAQTGVVRPTPTGAGKPYDDQVKSLLARPEIQAAFADVEQTRDRVLKEWITITEINAPSGKEQERAAFIENILRGYKSLDVRRDCVRNLIATGRGTGGRP